MNTATRQELVTERLDAIRRLLAEREASAALLTSRRNFAWATLGGENHVLLSGEDGVANLLVTPTDAVVLTAVNEAARIGDEEVADLPIGVEALPWPEDGAIDRAARRLAGSEPLDDAALEGAIVPLRCVLSGLEADRLAELGERAGIAMDAAIKAVDAGISEHEAAAIIAGRLASEGIRTPILLAAADDRIDRYRHPLPSSRRVRHRLMLVVVAERWGLHLAMTRFAELDEPDPELARRRSAVDRIHEGMVAATRPGQTLGGVFAATQSAYAAAGYPEEWRLHHQGGIIGYQGRERIAVPDDPTVIAEGMAFAWNPSITGAKTEATMLLTPDGPRILTAARHHPSDRPSAPPG
jgi:Xaa-Pro dipeptidase